MNQDREKAQFFSKPANRAIIGRCRQAIDRIPYSIPNDADIRIPLKVMLGGMESTPETFDHYCPMNLRIFGERFIVVADQIALNPEQTDNFEFIVGVAYRFLCELEISHPGEIDFELRSVRTFFQNHFNSLSPNMQREIVFIHHTMPTFIIKELINHPNIKIIKEFNNQYKSAEALAAEWQTELNKRENAVTRLSSSIKDLESEYNFVGLAHGFKKLSEEKESEKFFSRGVLFILAVLMFFPALGELAMIYTNRDHLDDYKNIILFSAPAIIAIELLLIYFFRVALGNYKSAKAQLLQINLRLSLCQFIQSYTEYSTNIKKSDSSALEKFESLVFSSINLSDDGIPATFDGIEQIAMLVKSAKSKGEG
jgi:hypothetical protein